MYPLGDLLISVWFCLGVGHAMSADISLTQVGHAMSEDKSLQRNQEFRFAQFIDHLFHVLDVPEFESSHVTDRNDCLLRCLKDMRCFSTNLAANPDINGNRVCELLPTDKYNASGSFGPSRHFHHYSIKV